MSFGALSPSLLTPRFSQCSQRPEPGSYRANLRETRIPFPDFPSFRYGTEELYFPEREFGGTPWQVPDNYNRYASLAQSSSQVPVSHTPFKQLGPSKPHCQVAHSSARHSWWPRLPSQRVGRCAPLPHSSCAFSDLLSFVQVLEYSTRAFLVPLSKYSRFLKRRSPAQSPASRRPESVRLLWFGEPLGP